MRIENQFVVPVAVDQAWETLLDVEHVAQCLPGATLSKVDGDRISGSVTVRVGPVTMVYRGDATFVLKDSAERRIVMEATGRDQRGAGSLTSSIDAQLVPSGEMTEVSVVTELALTGKPAQLGRGVISQVADRLVGQFAERLAAQLETSSGPGGGAAPTPGQTEPALDLMALMDARRATRWVAGAMAGLTLGLALWWAVRGR